MQKHYVVFLICVHCLFVVATQILNFIVFHEKNMHVKLLFNKNIEFKKQGACVNKYYVHFNYTSEKMN